MLKAKFFPNNNKKKGSNLIFFFFFKGREIKASMACLGKMGNLALIFE